ncbi:MAG: AzlC family ABC transporter permease [Afipia sp.]|nr:AzlC family ABC transporter permease [Afipia sp.]OJW61892.1 MAG: branched-chain amino acid permease (azaleucine resistance) [Afipia sp. 64-13]
MALPSIQSPDWQHAPRAFLLGFSSALTSVLGVVLFVTFLGVGAFSHDAGFSLGWALAGSLFVWAAPAQIILISTMHAGASVLESALAVTLSAIRLLPMVVAVLPMLRTAQTRLRDLALPAHFTAITFWVEAFRLLPLVPRQARIAFSNGLGVGFVSVCLVSTTIGYGLAAKLPPILAAGVLALTPLVFLLSSARNAHRFVDKAGLVLGLIFYPLISIYLHTGVDILLSGVSAGTIAYGAHRLRRRR